MASLRNLPGTKNLIACFTDINGKRRQRSTGTHVRKDAKRIADEFEAAARALKTETQIRQVMTDLFEEIHGVSLATSSAETFLTGWLKRKEAESAEATTAAYRGAVQGLLAHLGPKAKLDLNHIIANDVLSFRDGLIGKVSVSTINHRIKLVRIAFNAACRAGLMQSNPAMRVEKLHEKQKQGDESRQARRPFTMEEIQKILSVADQEWKEIIFFGLYTGQRLGDLANLKWENLHLAEEELRFRTIKTNRYVVLPLAQPLLRLIKQREQESGKTPLHPAAMEAVKKTKGNKVGTLSNQFYGLMAEAGLVPRRSKESTGRGRSGIRKTSEVSFHCLRHNATSLLKNAGVSDVVAREFVGHDSSAVSQLYTHIETATLRAAVAKLPDLTL